MGDLGKFALLCNTLYLIALFVKYIRTKIMHCESSWWRHQMETLFVLLAICAGNSPVPGEFPAQRPVTQSFDVFFDLRPDKRLSKQSWGWWFETPSHPLLRHRNVVSKHYSLLQWTHFNKPANLCPYQCTNRVSSDDINKLQRLTRYLTLLYWLLFTSAIVQ